MPRYSPVFRIHTCISYSIWLRTFSNNSIQAQPKTSAIQASGISPDTTPPVLLSFVLDLNSNTLMLTFSETVNGSTLVIPSLSLQNLPNALLGNKAYVDLILGGSGAALLGSLYSPMLMVKLDANDVITLQLNPTLGTSPSNTYLSMVNSNAVLDVSLNPVVQVLLNAALQAKNVTPSMQNPSLVSFSFDLNTGSLLLTFSDVIKSASVTPAAITIIGNNSFSLPLSGGQVNSTNGIVIQLILTNSDLNIIKMNLNSVGSNANNTYLLFTSSAAASNVYNNPVIVFSSPMKASSVVPDITPPRLLFFNLLTVGNGLSFVLYFSETVNSSTLNTSAISLQPNQNSSLVYTLTTATVMSGLSNMVSVTATAADAQNILAMPPLGQLPSTTFMVLPAGGILDASGIPMSAIPSSNAVQALNITANFIPPSLKSFTLDMTAGAGTFILTFSQPINSTSFNASKLTIQNDMYAPNASFTLTSVATSGLIRPGVMYLVLSLADSNAIKANPSLAVSLSTTFISLAQGLVVDFGGISSSTIAVNNAQQVASFVRDSFRPSLVAFSIDLSLNTVTLTFSETVNYMTFMPASIAFQNQQGAAATQTVQLTGGTLITNSYGPIITFQLTSVDANQIKARPNLATSNTTTFITITADAVFDMSANVLIPITSANALMVSGYNPDRLNPQLNSFDFDLNAGTITLHFNTTMNAATVLTSQMLLKNDTALTAFNYTLQNSTTVSMKSPDIIVTLGFYDLNQIKLLQICTNSVAGNCYLTMPINAAQDVSGNGMLPFSIHSPAIFINDTTSPVLTEFYLFNLSNGEIILRFSETVQASTFQPQFLTLQTLFDVPLSTYNLTGGSFSKSKEWLSTAQTVKDTSNNNLAPVLSVSPGRIVTILVTDVIPPTLVSGELNMNNATLTLIFDKPVVVTSVNIPGIRIQDSATVPQHAYNLTQGSAFATQPAAQIPLLSTYSRTPLTDNAFTPIGNTVSINATQVSFVPDTTPPTLLGYTLDLQTSTLTVTFDEPVSASSVNFSGLTFLASCSAGSSNQSQQLTSGTATTNFNILYIKLSPGDVSSIKIKGGIATSVSTTFLAVSSGAITDLAANGIRNISCLQVGAYTVSTAGLLSLKSFDFDDAAGILTMVFSDVVASNTFTAVGITIQAGKSRRNGPYYALTQSTTTQSPNGVEIIVQLSLSDFLNLKSIPGLATSPSTTYLTLQASVIEDTSTNNVLSIVDGKAMQVTQYTGDTSPPQINNFQLDLNTGTLNMTFTKLMNVSNIALQAIMLQNTSSGVGTSYNLTGGIAVRSMDGSTAIITLTQNDLNTLKSITTLCTSTNNTFVSFPAGLITDLANNPVQPVLTINATKVSVFTPDTTPPRLVGFTLNMNVSVLILTFSETVNLQTFNISGIVIQSDANITLSGSQYMLSLGNATLIMPTVVQVQLSRVDYLMLESNPALAATRRTTYISLDPSTITDMAGNPVQIISNNTAQKAQLFIYNSGSILMSFALNLQTRSLLFTFSDVISSFDPTAITLQNAAVRNSGGYYILQCGSLSSPALDVRVLQLCPTDLFAIQMNTNLARSLNTTFISLNSTAFVTVFGTPVQTIPPIAAQKASNFTASTSGPILLNFTLDLNSASLYLTFDEVVNSSTVIISDITIQSSSSYVDSLVAFTLSDSFIVLPSGNIINIRLGSGDFNTISLLSHIATSTADTYLNITAAAAYDIYGNPYIPQPSAIQAQQYIPSTIPPVLVSSMLDLNASQLILTFSKSVNVTTLDVTKVTFNNQSGTQGIPLTSNSFTNSPNGKVVIINIGQGDFNVLVAGNKTCTSVSNCFVSFAAGAIADTYGNLVQYLAGQQIANYTPDAVRPQLRNFTFDVNAGMLTLTFSETVNLLSIRPDTISLIDSLALQNPVMNLSAITPATSYLAVVRLTLTLQDLNAVKANTLIGTSLSNTIISIVSATISDMRGNPVVPTAIQAASYTNDTSNPTLNAFYVDDINRKLILVFNEYINVSTINLGGIILHATQLPPYISYTFPVSTSSQFSVVNYSSVVISMTLADYTNLVDSGACTAQTKCFITVYSNFAQDASQLRVIQTTLQVTALLLKTTPPSLALFVNFDFNKGQLTLSFTDDVRVRTFNVSTISLYSFFTSTSPYVTLTGGSVSPNDSSTVVVTLTNNDLNRIKAMQSLSVCSATTFCYVRFPSTLVQDIVGNQVAPVVSSSNFIVIEHAANITPDTTPPQLVSFDLNMNTLQLNFTFNEVLDPASFNGQALTFVNARNGSLNYTLTGIATNTLASPSTVITATLTNADAVAIKATLGLAISKETTYLAIASTFIRDVGAPQGLTKNYLLPVVVASAIQVSNYVPDTTPPMQIAFTLLDMNIGNLYIGAEEPLSSTIMATYITLQQSAGSGANYTLTGDNVTYVNVLDKRVIIVKLSYNDLKGLKLSNGLCTSTINCFLNLAPDAIGDSLGNSISAIIVTPLMQFIPDTTAPQLLQFSLDMNIGQLSATFSNVVNVATLLSTKLTLMTISNVMYTLTTGYSNSSNGYVIVVQIMDVDLNAIKSRPPLATSKIYTNLSITADLIRSLAGIPVVPTALMVTNFINDTTSPRLTSFQLDYNAGILTLRFSEAINPATFNVTGIQLQGASDIVNAGSSFLKLTGGIVSTSSSNAVYSITLTSSDLNLLKQLTPLGTSSSTTYLSITPSSAQDFSGNFLTNDYVPGSALQLSGPLALDVIPPTLTGFDFDLNVGKLVVSFSETVNSSTFVISSFTIQDAAQATRSYRLTAGTLVQPLALSQAVEVIISATDLNNIKSTNGLATSANSTYLSNLYGAVADTSGNLINLRLTGVQVKNYSPDISNPILQMFVLDLNTATLVLNFSKAVNSSSLNSAGISLQNSRQGTLSVSLTGGTVVMYSGTTLTLALSSQDTNTIKLTNGLGTSTQNTFLSVTNTTVQDTFGNAILAIPSSNALMASNVTADRSPPSLNNFAVDLNQGLLNLTFSEPVNTTSLNFTSIMLSGVGATMTLSAGTVIQSTGTVVVVMLSRGDLNIIKLAQQNFALCSSMFTCGLSLTQYAATDIAGNDITPVSPAVYPTSVIPDTTPPRLESFDAISNSSASGLFTLVLHFSEPVLFLGTTPTVMSLSSSINGTFYVLQYSTIIMVSSLAADIVVVLDGRDVSNLLLMPNLLQRSAMTYLKISAGAYRSLTLSSTTADLVSATSIQVILSFSEPVNISTSIPLKLVLEQALTPDSTFIQLPSDAITTVGTNTKTVIGPCHSGELEHNSEGDCSHISDTTPAVLQGFSFQINPAIIVFTFNKAVNGSTFDPTFITLQSGPTRASIQYTLTGGTASKSNANFVQLNLTSADQLNIQLLSGLAVSQNTTYLSLSTFAAMGINNLYVQPISPNAALEASSYVNASAPHLTKFNLDLNAGTITFVFDTSIDISTFNISDIVLRNATSANLRFTGGIYSTKVSTSQVVVTLTSSDYDFIITKNLCNSNQTCFISCTSKVASDIFGNPVSASTIRVTTLIPDTTSPVLVEFVLFNLTSLVQGVFRFSKPVDVSSFNISGLMFQSLFDAPVATYIPSATLYVVAQSSRLVAFELSSYDTASIKSNPNLCSIRGNCYVSVTSSLIKDSSGNLLSNISNAYPGQIVTTLIADALPANIVAFALDMNANQLLLTFDKPVRPSSLVATAITIQASSNQTTNASLFYHLTGGSTNSPIQTIINVNISYTDANILRMLPFAKGVNSTFLSVTSNIIQDTSFYPNPTTPIPCH
ncbi:hypothetical protein EMCRGX_G018693 [Ephydatia muelleri]